MNTTIETTVPVRSTPISQTFAPPVWSPMERLASLRQDMDRLWEATFPGRSAALSMGWSPSLDLHDEAEQLVVRVELPGFSRDAIELNYQDGVLTVAVPVQGDKIAACYKDGLLTVTLPKSEDAKPHKVEVTAIQA
jgi:HSP20 family protein